MEIFHKGEKELQERLGSRVNEAKARERILTSLVPQAVNFIHTRDCSYLSNVDDAGSLWLSPIIGKGSIQVHSLSQINIDLDRSLLAINDLLPTSTVTAIGLLFIDAPTRRRYRVNGMAIRKKNVLEVTIKEAYSNCPKYIQARTTNYFPLGEAKLDQGNVLLKKHIELIQQADTFFVASLNPNGNMDASHRGGNPGFIVITKDGKLRIPDYAGNGLFNTLGNFLICPKAGLLFFDYKHNAILQLSGSVEIFISDQDSKNRYWEFCVEKWKYRSQGLKMQTQLFDYSPFNP